MTPDVPEANLAVMLAEVRGDVRLVLSKVDDTNRRVGVAEQRLDKQDAELGVLKAQMWRWVGASSVISALVSSGAAVAILKMIAGG